MAPMRSIQKPVGWLAIAEPPVSARALADQFGSTYHFVEAANGLSARPLLVVVVELLLEDEELEELLDEDDELLLEELELLEELLLEDELLELDEDELLLEDELLELDEDEELELLEDDELELDELLLDEDEELELLEELEVEPLIEPADAVRVTRSSLAPSSRRTIRSVWLPAAKLVKVTTAIVP